MGDEKFYQIVCPYCFNESNEPFSDEDVCFRAESCFADEAALERRFDGQSREEIEAINGPEDPKLKEYDICARFLAREDRVYQDFWSTFAGTSEQDENQNRAGNMLNRISIPQWQRPIISVNTGGVNHLKRDADGFVFAAVDTLGKETTRRVCPYCHNPLPINFGKNPVKNIVIVGVTGAGKTVYISQLLSSMEDYAAKVGLSASVNNANARNFVKANPVKLNVPLPFPTAAESLSQPMFYEISYGIEGNKKQDETIVVYDIAGENCEDATKMQNFSKFVRHADGLILLIHPKQLGLTKENASEEKLPSTVLQTLHSVLEGRQGHKSHLPIAVCISQSDTCFDLLPAIASQDVGMARFGIDGLCKREFDYKTYNQFSKEIAALLQTRSQQLIQALITDFYNFNFFAVSAVGCECADSDEGGARVSHPIEIPHPYRIEEPIFWLFRKFNFIGLEPGGKVRRPFPVALPDKIEIKKRMFGKPQENRITNRHSDFEDEPIPETEETVEVKQFSTQN